MKKWDTVYLNLAKSCQQRNQWDRAIEYAEKNAQIGKDVGDMKLILQSHIIMGLSYDRMGEYDQAIFHYKEALNIMDEIENDLKKGDVYHVVGMLYEQKGQMEEAQYYYEKGKLHLR